MVILESRYQTSASRPMVPILYVDDNEARLMVRSAWLAEAGYRVLSATTGREALAIAARDKVAAVILDVHLPDVGGVEICRRLRATQTHEATPIVLFSAMFRSPHDQLEGLNEGATLYLAEPMDKDAFLSAIRRALH